MLRSDYKIQDKPFKAGQDFGNIINQVSQKEVVKFDNAQFYVYDVSWLFGDINMKNWEKMISFFS